MVLVNDCFFLEPTLLKKRDIHMVLLQTSLNYWFHTWHGQVDGFQEWRMKYQDQQQTTARNIHQDSHGRSKDIKQDRSWRGHVILKQSSHQAVSYPRIDSWVKAPAPQTKRHIQHEWNSGELKPRPWNLRPVTSPETKTRHGRLVKFSTRLVMPQIVTTLTLD